MLHDVLMALAGHVGDIVVESPVAGEGYVVSELFAGISQSERSIVDSVVSIGHKYRLLEDFVRGVRQQEYCFVLSTVIDDHEALRRTGRAFGSPGTAARLRTGSDANRADSGLYRDTSTAYNGYYINSMCSGIDEYLEEYRENLVTLEKVVLADPALPLSTLSILLGEQKAILETLLSIVADYRGLVDEKRAAGDPAAVLRVDEMLLLLQGSTCNTTVRAVYARLYDKCLALFRLQMRSWICRGQLVDPHSEFVVCRRRLAPDGSEEGDLLGESGLHAFENLREELTSDASDFEWHYSFYLSTKEPRWMQCSYRTWKDVLFLGKAARMLIRRYHNEHQLEAQAAHIFNEWTLVCASPSSFDKAIEQYRSWVAQLFWVYVNERCDVRAHFALFRQVYFMGYHSLYTAFMERAWFTMQTPCNLESCTNMRLDVWRAVAHLEEIRSWSEVEHYQQAGADCEMLEDADTRSPRRHSGPFELDAGDMLSGCATVYSSFEFRQRTYYFNMAGRRVVLCGDAAWIDDEIVLNVSEQRLDEPIGGASESGAVWIESPVHVSGGFDTGFCVELSQLEAAAMYSESKMRGVSLGRFCRFALVLQSKVPPTRLTGAAPGQIAWSLLRDGFAVEFEVEYDNLGPKDSEVHVTGCVYLKGENVVTVSGGRFAQPATDAVLCVNRAREVFRLAKGGRDEFTFGVRLRISRKRFYAELIHTATGRSLILETDVMDSTQMLQHDFGDCFLGIVSTPYQRLNPAANVDLVRRNCALRVSRWDFAGCLSKYDMLAMHEQEAESLGHEPFLREMPDLRELEFESGLNDWMYVTLAYRCGWPASILLDLPTMLAYNSIFQLLFLLRRCTYGLESLCHLNPRMRKLCLGRTATPVPEVCRRASCIRWRLYVFMGSLLSYLQQCVVERCYLRLRETVEQSGTLQEIKVAHDHYIRDIAVNCFLDRDTVLQPLLVCMDACLKFATLYYCAFNGTSDVDLELVMRRLGEFSVTFERNMTLINERLLLLSNDPKYSILSSFVEMCSSAWDA